MILTTCGPRRIPTLWRLLERNLSTKSRPATASQVSVLSHSTLPTPKMRALISLYHQADSWVTPENLLEKIDEAFVQSETLALSSGREENMVSVSDMKNYIGLRRQAPKIAQWDSSSLGSDPAVSQWSESGKNKRDLKVLEALYGVTAFDHSTTNISQAFLPGLEVLQELGSSAIQDHKDDREAEDLQDLLLAKVRYKFELSMPLYHVLLFTGTVKIWVKYRARCFFEKKTLVISFPYLCIAQQHGPRNKKSAFSPPLGPLHYVPS